MRHILPLFSAVLWTACALAQSRIITNADLRGTVDSTSATATKPFRTVTSDPTGSCSATNEVVMNSTTGVKTSCVAGTWVTQATGTAGNPAGDTGDVQVNNSGSFGVGSGLKLLSNNLIVGTTATDGLTNDGNASRLQITGGNSRLFNTGIVRNIIETTSGTGYSVLNMRTPSHGFQITVAGGSTGGGLSNSFYVYDETATAVRLLIGPTGRMLFGTSTDDGSTGFQFAGSASITGTLAVTSSQTWTQISAPSTPASGKLVVYAKTSAGLCWKDSTGTETCGGASSGGSGTFPGIQGVPGQTVVTGGDGTSGPVTVGVVPNAAGQLIPFGFVLGADDGTALVDTNDQNTIFANQLGFPMHVKKIWCQTDTGTATINLVRHGDGSGISASNIVCSTTGASSTTFTTGNDAIIDGALIDLTVVTAATSGTPHRISVFGRLGVD